MRPVVYGADMSTYTTSESTNGPVTRLGQILEEEGRYQTWLAEKVGISRATLNRYVKGLHVPDDKRALIAEALGREISDVFPEKKEPQV